MNEEIVKTFEIADEMYEHIVDQCDLKSDNPLARAALIGELKAATGQQLVSSIMNHMDAAQAKHFKDFQRQEFKINPEKSEKAILIEFGLLYPDLMDKVYQDLAYFFIEFVIDFNQISNA